MRNDNMKKIIIWLIVLAMVLVTFASAVSVLGN